MMIFAEIGINHCGNEKRAQNLLEGILNTGVDGLTFQIRERSFYDGSHPRKVELSDEFYANAIKRAHNHDIRLGFAISQPEKIDFLDAIGADFWKTLSWEITNEGLQRTLEKTGKPVYISTGVSGLDDITKAAKLFPNASFIHTQLDYDLQNVNLRAIHTIREATKSPVAFGSHCRNMNVLFVAVAYTPTAIFFYVKDETDGEHPDDIHAIRLGQVACLVKELKSLSTCLGTGEKQAHENRL